MAYGTSPPHLSRYAGARHCRHDLNLVNQHHDNYQMMIIIGVTQLHCLKVTSSALRRTTSESSSHPSPTPPAGHYEAELKAVSEAYTATSRVPGAWYHF
jgi:hypothetical protein